MTSKEALEKELATPMTYIEKNGVYYEVPEWVKNDLEVLEKIIDIIQHKQFSGYAILDTENVEEYNHRVKLGNLTQEEYDLLKGLLKKGLENDK